MPPTLRSDESRNRLAAAHGTYRIVIELADPRRFLARASDAL